MLGLVIRFMCSHLIVMNLVNYGVHGLLLTNACITYTRIYVHASILAVAAKGTTKGLRAGDSLLNSETVRDYCWDWKTANFQ